MPILDHRTRMVVAFGLGPSPSAELALEAWAEAKAFLRTRVGGLPRVLVHHDQGGPFLSHDWVGTLLREGQRLSYSLMGAKGNPVVESFFARFKVEVGGCGAKKMESQSPFGEASLATGRGGRGRGRPYK